MSNEDKKQLEERARRMMDSLCWSPENTPDWDGFRALFHKDARLVPAARPAAPISVETFIERMDGQRVSGALTDFTEEHVALQVHVFGNVASAMQTYRTIINKGEPGFGISAMTWVRDNDQWQCLIMAWDAASSDKEIPEELL